jgi:hypothetical protein
MAYEDIYLAIDRLIYQTDTCRIFHFSNQQQYQSVRDLMTKFTNQQIWILHTETIDKFGNGYLIYHLRSQD